MVVASALDHPAATRCALVHSMETSTPLAQGFCGAAQNDLQAQARAHRLGQTRTVMIYRCAARLRSGTPAQPGMESLCYVVGLFLCSRPASEHVTGVLHASSRPRVLLYLRRTSL